MQSAGRVIFKDRDRYVILGCVVDLARRGVLAKLQGICVPSCSRNYY